MRNPVPSITRILRDNRFWRVAMQVLFILLIIAVAVAGLRSVQQSLAQMGLKPGFGFLRLEAAFAIGETPISYQPSDTYGRAFLVGVVNTLRVAVVGIILTTILGFLIGVARLSTNWLANKLSTAFVELFRNTPVLLQLFFWYFAVVLKFPRAGEAASLPGPVYLSNKAVALPWFTREPGFYIWLAALLAGIVVAYLLWRWRLRVQVETGRATYPALVGLSAFAVFALAGWFASGGHPVALTLPTKARFGFKGGAILTPEYTALTLGLTTYTAAFVAEIVRAGLQSVSKGQVEAARAVGLNQFQTLRLVIFPQAFRVMIPSITSQYLNLTKNSSLAVAIGYPDLFSVAFTIFNQTGRSLETIFMIMVAYLSVSLFTSIVMNQYNRRVQLVER